MAEMNSHAEQHRPLTQKPTKSKIKTDLSILAGFSVLGGGPLELLLSHSLSLNMLNNFCFHVYQSMKF